MSRVRKILLRILLVVVAGLVAFWGIRAWLTARHVAGIYLTNGGMGCVAIVREGLWRWRVDRIYPGEGMDWSVDSVSPRLIVEASAEYSLPSGESLDWGSVHVLKRSAARPGDWDLVASGYDIPDWAAMAGRRNWFERLRDKLFPGRASPTPLNRTLRYYHRVDDQRIVECFDRIYTRTGNAGPVAMVVGVYWERLPRLIRRAIESWSERKARERRAAALEKARAILQDYPDDLHVRAFYIYTAACADDVEEVSRRLDTWKADFDKTDDAYVSWAVRVLRNWLRARRLTMADRNLYDFCVEVLGPETDLPTRLRRMAEVYDHDAYAYPYIPSPYIRAMPNFLNIQLGIKVFRVVSIFQMIQGKRDEALRLLVSSFRLGQMMSQDGMTISRLIGASLQANATGGLGTYLANCCETEDEVRRFWEVLETLAAERRPIRKDDLVAFDSPGEVHLSGDAMENWNEAITRMRICEARFDLLRAATAARFRFVRAGDFPTTASEFAPLLPDGLPPDIFSDGPLRFRSAREAFVVYSCGPDEGDDDAAVAYDPTNGTFSGGDLVFRLPREREFPFPREGTRAASIDDLRRQYPNGLSADPFATNWGRGLSAAESADGDVYVWSFGPDVDEYKGPNPLTFHTEPATGTVLFRNEIPAAHWPPPVHRLEVPYDPTNGIVSEGDLWIRLPAPSDE